MPDKYVLGIDFGTQSGRTALVRIRDGETVNVAVKPYPHGVMTDNLPTGTQLPPSFALQHPGDYLEVLKQTILEVLQTAGKRAQQIVGVGIAATSSTILPVLQDGTPLCFLPEFADDPHSWPKLWKHHGAQAEAAELDTFIQKNAPELAGQFSTGSAERLLPKVLEVMRRSPKVYGAAYTFVELADWLTWQLTGQFKRSAPIAGYKAMWRPTSGYLKPELLKDFTWEYAEIINNKLPGPVVSLGCAGKIATHKAHELNLAENTMIAVGHIDAHAATLGCGVSEPGTLVMVMGTSSCHMLLADRLEYVEGMSGAVKGGIIGDYYAYEAGQSSVGDQFNWFVENAVPGTYQECAKELGLDIYSYLETLARELPLGGTGLLVLDWWNGNRSVLNNSNLSGLIMGLTTTTKPEEIYLALLESTAFGARRIMDSFEEKGLAIKKICAVGGLPRQNSLLMDIYSTVLDRDIEVTQSDYTSALGMAMWASVAAGPELGGYQTIYEAIEKMAPKTGDVYRPISKYRARYSALYEDYKTIYDYFGREKRYIMEGLRATGR